MITMECNKCAVATTCPARGSSPTLHGKHKVLCKIIGGFGKKPIDRAALSARSASIAEKNGQCLTIAEVPFIDDDGGLVFHTVKIFSPPVLSDREKNVPVTSSDVLVRSFK